MSTTLEIVASIARRLRRGAPAGSNFESEIILEMKLAQEKLEEGPTLPQFLQTQGIITPLANEGELLLSDLDTGDSVIRLQDDVPLAYDDEVSDEFNELLLESELKILRQKFPGFAEQAQLAHFAGDRFHIRPIPTQAYDYIVRYYKHDIAPISGNSTGWTTNFPDLIINMTGKEVAWPLRDSEAFTLFEKDLAFARDRFIKAVTAAEQAGQTHIMGDD